MGAKTRVSKWGTSLAIRIPKSIAEQWGIHEGSAIELTTQDDRVILEKSSYDLNDLLAQIEPANLHPEHDTGPAQDKEQW